MPSDGLLNLDLGLPANCLKFDG